MAIKGYWKLNGNSNDYSGNGNNGVDTAITYSQANGIFNQGAGLNGTSSKIIVADNAGLRLTSYTAAAWFKTTNTSFNKILYKGNGSSIDEISLYVYLSGKVIIEYFESGGYNYYAVSPTANYADGKWHFVVGTRQVGGNMTLYIDGKQVDQRTAGTRTTTSTAALGIGVRNLATPDSFFNGSLDEVLLDDSVWAPAHVKNKLSQYKGFF